MQTLPITPMTLGDMFDRLFKLIGKTWTRNLAVSGLILFLPTMLITIGMDMFFSFIQESTKHAAESADIQGIAKFLGGFVGFFIGYIALMIGTIMATLGVTIIGCSEFNGNSITWQEALTRTFSIRLLRMFGLYALEILLLGCVVLIPYFLMIFAVASESTFFSMVAVPVFLAAVWIVVYVAIRWAFAIPALANEDVGIIDSLMRSWRLVENNWWRVLGILFLFSLILSFAVSLVMTPVYLIAMWDFFAAYFQMLGSGEPDPSAFTDIFSSFGLRFGIIFGLSTLLQVVLSPLLTVVLYFDLRARAGEFNDPLQSQSLLFP